jgi:hypothetical protein
MNTTVEVIHRAAQSDDPVAAIATVRDHVATLDRLDLTEAEAADILDSSSTIALKAGMVAEAAVLEEAASAVRDGGIVPRVLFFGWIPAAPAKAGTPTASVPEPAKATQRTGPQEVIVTAMPPRVTRTVVTRDKQGRITSTTQVQEDVQ